MNILTYFQTVYLSYLLQLGPSTLQPEHQIQAIKLAVDSVKIALQAEAKYDQVGLINVSKVLPTSYIDIRYSYEDNFLKEDMYGPYCACHLHPDAIDKLKKAYELLQVEKPGYSFIFYDCTRPVSVQFKMWNALGHLSPVERSKYVSNPLNHSIHNYALAIDMGLVDEKGKVCDMGTDFDYFGILAYPSAELKLLNEGKLTSEQVSNRLLMRRVMEKVGFRQQSFEWWHYNTMSRDQAKAKYKPFY